MDNSESLGVVSGAYFVGRVSLLRWINELTQLNYSKIEQTASGVFVCHVFDALYPGQIRFDKVKFNARHPYEFVHNYKILQACFGRMKMKRQVDVESLIKGKYQDNLEFMQWVKAYFDAHACERALSYDGRARREEVMAKTGTPVVRPALSNLQANSRPPANASSKSSASSSPRSQPAAPSRPRTALHGAPKTAKTAPSAATTMQLNQLKQQVKTLKGENQTLLTNLSDAETEREFYFNKLRKVEVILQALLPEEGHDVGPMDDMDVSELRAALEDIRVALYSEDDQAVANPEDVAFEEDAAYELELQNDAEYRSDNLLPEEVPDAV